MLQSHSIRVRGLKKIGGQYDEYLCDLHITNKEALNIISQNEELKTVRDIYKKQVKWTKEFFVDSGLKNYLFYECNLNETKNQNVMKKLNVHKDIKMEFYETIMYEEFPFFDSATRNKNAITAKCLRNAFLTYLK